VGVPHEYGKRMALVHLVIAALLAWFLGARGVVFIAATLFGFFAVSFLLSFVVRRALPPLLELRPYDTCK
jgi:hypothetical protein